jgi:hypothetical protein
MSRNAKIALVVVGILMLLGAGLVFAAGAKVYHDGVLTVRVEEKEENGVSFTLPVPVTLVKAGLGFIPERELEQVRREIGPWMPAITALCEELARIPDGPLVEVDGPGETVRIVKRGGALIVDVDTECESVYVSIPLGAVLSIVQKIGSTGPAAVAA